MRLLSKKMRVVFNWKLLPIQRLLSNVRLRPAKGILSNIELLFFLNHKLLPNQGLWINMGLWEAKVLLSNMGLVPKSKKWYYTKLRISVLLSTPCSSWQGFFSSLRQDILFLGKGYILLTTFLRSISYLIQFCHITILCHCLTWRNAL